MRRPLPFLFLALAVLAAVGVRAGWFHQGFSEAQLEQLETDWAQLVGWAQLSELEGSEDRPLEELARDWRAGGDADEAYGAVLEDQLARVARAELSPETRAMLERFESLLDEGRTAPPLPDTPVIPLLKLGQLALRTEDLDAERVGQLLALSRRFQREGNLMMFMIGIVLGDEALDRCRADASLTPARVPAPAPEPDEVFHAFCRDFVQLNELTTRELDALGMDDPLKEFSGADEFLEQSMRRAMANIAQRYYPLRDEPQRFGEIAGPEKPGQVEIWIASTFRRPERMARVLETLFQPDIAMRGGRWVEFCRNWNEVLN